MSYIYLFLSLLSSLLIAVILKGNSKKGNGSVIIASNYIIAGGTALALTKFDSIPSTVLIMGLITGGLFFAGFLVFNHAIASCGMTSAVTAGRLSLAVPAGISILFLNEKADLFSFTALAGIVAVIVLWEKKLSSFALPLLMLFLIFGFNDTALKIFKHYYGSVDQSMFLGIIFCSAIVWSWIYIIVRKETINSIDVKKGLLMGIPNFFSSFFVMKALETIPAYVVFPAINVGVIIASAITGYIFFEEKLGRRKILLILTGCVSVLLLTYGGR